MAHVAVDVTQKPSMIMNHFGPDLRYRTAEMVCDSDCKRVIAGGHSV